MLQGSPGAGGSSGEGGAGSVGVTELGAVSSPPTPRTEQVLSLLSDAVPSGFRGKKVNGNHAGGRVRDPESGLCHDLPSGAKPVVPSDALIFCK